jgi:hypothetical protein
VKLTTDGRKTVYHDVSRNPEDPARSGTLHRRRDAYSLGTIIRRVPCFSLTSSWYHTRSQAHDIMIDP